MNLKRTFAFLVAATILTSIGVATEPMRVWVDKSGRFSIDARLVEIDKESIVLLRKSGGTVVLRRDKISDRDEAYLAEVEKDLESVPNSLRSQPPTLPPIAALSILDLPDSDYVADEDSRLLLGHTTVAPPLQLPAAVEPDASPYEVRLSAQKYSIGHIDSYDVVSRIHPIADLSASESGDAASSIALSISSGMRLPGQTPKGRIIRFDAGSNQPTTVWQSSETIRMFDHHLPSGRSLVLVGHSALGNGGQLAIASGWNRVGSLMGNQLEISTRRKLPVPENLGRLQTVHWARWIDEEHVCVLLDRTLVIWNLVSGEQIFRVDGVIEKSFPALSAGRRYVAVPGTGTVDLYRTSDGQPLGRIAVESNSIPSVSFAPRGDALAIATIRRLRVWDLPSAALRADVESRKSLGNDPPLWISDDLVMSGSGVLTSLFRGVPIWQYEMTGATSSSMGSQVAVLRKTPAAELSIVSVPHEGAMDAIKWIDSSPRPADIHQWRIPGRSVWTDGQWTDRDVRLSTLEINYR